MSLPEWPAREWLRLGESDKALDDLNAVLAKSSGNRDALELRAIAQARLGKKEPALADLARYQKDRRNGPGSTWRPSSRRSSVTGPTPQSRPWKPRCGRSRGTPTCVNIAAAAFALASKAAVRDDHAEGRAWPHERSPCFRRRSGTTT